MKYIPTIGLELHCELNTKSKVFSKGINHYNEIPNSHIAPLDMAYPGTLPVVNKEAVHKALKMALALNCEIPKILMFDRKNYYYPDLPKGYQITQMEKPIGINGYLEIILNRQVKKVLIHDIHLEEDTASMDHYDDFSLLDYNRAGVPLVEIVTEPCLHSSDEVIAYLETLRNTFKYCDISDADTKLGQIRCDLNISMQEENVEKLGTKVEIKNINSFANVKNAIDYEIKRQTSALENGKKEEITQETRRYDDETKTTISMRQKSESIDYKYFVEPNIPKIKITEEYITEVQKEVPQLPAARMQKYLLEYNLSEKDAQSLIKDKNISDYFDECVALGINPQLAANWINVNVTGVLNKEDISIKEFYLTPKMLKQIIDKINDKTISSKQAKDIFNQALEEKKEPKEFFTSDNMQISDDKKLKEIIQNILANNPSQVADYKNGKDNLFKYFVGQVMKETKGKANPNITSNILKEELNK